MKLLNYYDKKVKITDTNGKVWKGFVSDYFYPDDNENGKESIALESPAVEFYESDIKSIEIIND